MTTPTNPKKLPRKPRRPTSFEVAALAGVSRSTVSLVLTGNDKIALSNETKQRVWDAAQTLGYVPYAAARTLASGLTHTLGLLICHAEHLRIDALIPQAILGLHRVSQQRGFKVIIEAIEDLNRPETYLELVHATQVDGLVVLNPKSGDAGLQTLVEEGFPVVIMGAAESPQAHTISGVDNTTAAQRATAHLIALGHTRVAHTSYGGLEYQGANERSQGYRRALTAADLPYNPALMREGNYSAESGF